MNNDQGAVAPPQAQLIIAMNAQGGVSLQGPLDNVPMCYAMLELAKDAIRTNYQRKAQSAVQPVPFMPRGLA